MTFRGCLSVLLLCVVSVRSDVDDEEKGELRVFIISDRVGFVCVRE